MTKTIQTEKKFDLPETSWSYCNTFRFDHQSDEQLPKLKIKNHLCELHDNKLRRVTEISLRGKNYSIEDIYSINPNHMYVPEKVNKDGGSTNDSEKNEPKEKRYSDEKKVYIFKKQRRSR